MTASISGSPDFISQGGDTNTFLGTFSGNSLNLQVFDITSLVDPSMQALIVQLIAPVGSAITRGFVQLNYTPGVVATPNPTMIQVGIPITLPIDTQVIPSGVANFLLMGIFRVVGDAAADYKFHVWGVTAWPQVYPVRKYDLSGHGDSLLTVCPGAAVTVCTPNIVSGCYRRIRLLSWATQGAPGVVTNNDFRLSGSTHQAWIVQFPGAGFGSGVIAIDWSIQDTLSFNNGSAVGCLVTVAWEDVPV